MSPKSFLMLLKKKVVVLLPVHLALISAFAPQTVPFHYFQKVRIWVKWASLQTKAKENYRNIWIRCRNIRRVCCQWRVLNQLTKQQLSVSYLGQTIDRSWLLLEMLQVGYKCLRNVLHLHFKCHLIRICCVSINGFYLFELNRTPLLIHFKKFSLTKVFFVSI